MANIIEFIINGIGSIFTQLANFEFLGTNMLKFSLTIMILSVLIPIIFTIPKNVVKKGVGYSDKKSR